MRECIRLNGGFGPMMTGFERGDQELALSGWCMVLMCALIHFLMVYFMGYQVSF